MKHTGMECLQRLLTYPPIENPALIIDVAHNIRSYSPTIIYLDYIIGKYPTGKLSLPKSTKKSQFSTSLSPSSRPKSLTPSNVNAPYIYIYIYIYI